MAKNKSGKVFVSVPFAFSFLTVQEPQDKYAIPRKK